MNYSSSLFFFTGTSTGTIVSFPSASKAWVWVEWPVTLLNNNKIRKSARCMHNSLVYYSCSVEDIMLWIKRQLIHTSMQPPAANKILALQYSYVLLCQKLLAMFVTTVEVWRVLSCLGSLEVRQPWRTFVMEKLQDVYFVIHMKTQPFVQHPRHSFQLYDTLLVVKYLHCPLILWLTLRFSQTY